MTNEGVLLISFAFGLAAMALGGLGFQSWREGSKATARLKAIEKENQERLAKAKKEAAQGRRKQSYGVLFVILAFFTTLAFLLFARGALEGF